MDEMTSAPRKRGRPKGSKSTKPNFGKELAKPGETGGYVRSAMVAWSMPPIDISQIDQVEKRAQEYLEYCAQNDAIPNKSTLCMWLGINRSTLHSWERGEYRKETHQAFAKRVDALMEAVLVELMENNRVHPGSGCFLLKNHSGYRDQIDIAPVAPDPLGELPDEKLLAEKIHAHLVEE